jgi:phage tail-like protein
MDANRSRLHQLAASRHWRALDHAAWDGECGALRLASERPLETPIDAAAFAAANSALETVPRAVDRFGSVARWDAGANAVVVHSAGFAADAAMLSLAEAPTDLCVGHDGVLYLALAEGVRMHDLRGRFDPVMVSLAGFVPWRLAADGSGGVWAVERASGRLARLTGRPLPITTPPRDAYAPQVFRPDPENCRPPVLEELPAIAWPAGERPVALTAHPRHGLLLLSWGVDGAAGLRRLDRLDRFGRLLPALALPQGRYGYAIAWHDDGTLALRLPLRRDVPAFFVPPASDDDAGSARTPYVLGGLWPLLDGAREAPLAHRVEGPPRYPLGDADAEPLLPLSYATAARHGEARHWSEADGALDAQWLDSGTPGCAWHRLYAEAAIPPGTGFIVWAAATDEPVPPGVDEVQAWAPHAFGRDIAALAPLDCAGAVPRAAWERSASELPGHPGLARWSAEPGERGLFGLLLQDGAHRVRRIAGRFLWLRVALHGDGRATPEIAALRAWSQRFDYLEQYLPRFLHETEYGDAALSPGQRLGTLPEQTVARLDAGGRVDPTIDAALTETLAAIGVRPAEPPWIEPRQPGERWRLVDTARKAAWLLEREPAGARAVVVHKPKATPSDFLSRLLANFEGILTPLEDRIAAAHLLTQPATIPEPQLDWLAGWIGVAFDAVLPAQRRREWLAEAPRLARWHGTRRGLSLALDIATGGAVRGGEVVVIEDFRLRRLLATLLGVDLTDEEDPLLPGLHRSGNSVVGDTLILGDEPRAELMALFRGDQATAAENRAVQTFYERLAHRATIFVHRELEPQDFGLIRRIAAIEAPAHVEVRVVAASRPLVVGVSSLVGVDTYLTPKRAPRPVRVARTAVGMGDVVRQGAMLDARLAGSVLPPPPAAPRADAGPDREAAFGRSFMLDGSGSTAAPGRALERYIWRRLPPAE